MKRFIFPLLIILFPTFSNAAPDQSQAKIFSFTPIVGVYSGFGIGALNPKPHTSDVPGVRVFVRNKGLLSGMMLGFNLTNHIEIQGSFTYSQSEIIHDVGIGIAGIPLGEFRYSDVKTFTWSGNFLYNVPIKRTVVFVEAGLGALTYKPERLKTKTKFLISLGGGAKFNLTHRISLMFGVKDFVSFFDFAKDFEMVDFNLYNPDFKKTQHKVGINIGLVFYL